jgi:hypothetical protein
MKSLTGLRSGRLVIEGRVWSPSPKRIYWAALCDCGQTIRLRSDQFGKTQSCGCLQKEKAVALRLRHGLSDHPAYGVWKAMRQRCRLETKNAAFYRNYASRGLRVCEAWNASFDAFWADMGPTYREGLTLERVDNDKGYSPGNCVWATRAVQCVNKRTNVWVDTPRGRMTASQVAKAYDLKIETVLARLRLGFTGEDVLARPHSAARDGRRTRWQKRA